MNQRNVVITGGAGFIGSNLADELINDNHVTIIDDLSTGILDNIAAIINDKHVKFVRGNILDQELLESIFRGNDIVFHLAAIPSVAHSIEDPMFTNQINITGTLNVLIAARNNSVKKVVFASSSAVYGENTLLPAKEDVTPDLRSPYALTKLTGEYYCRLFTQLYGLSTICLRYFNVYGPRQDPTSEYSAVIPKLIDSLLKHHPPAIYGDGNQTRDFVFIKDVVRANITAAESELSGVFNIGGGKSISINNLAQKIITILGSELQPIHQSSRIGETRNSWADLTRARSIGYHPKYTLEKGLFETIKSIRMINREDV
jgi:UDP-glucose 4-epimerase